MIIKKSIEIPSVSHICLSIVLPIYNVSKYLDRCMDTLLKTEGIEKTEIIIVDDGSTDESGTIADNYACKYNYISCYHKKNGGLSDARNYGLRLAKGKYVFFCDPDDMVIPEGLSTAIMVMLNSDTEVLLWDGVTIDDDDSVIESIYDGFLVHSGIDQDRYLLGTDVMIEQITDHGKYAMTAWLMACSRRFLMTNELYFECGLIHEDELWTPKVLLYSKRVQYLKQVVYRYRIRNDSIIGASSLNLEDHAKAIVYIRNSLFKLYSHVVRERKKRVILLANWAESYMWDIVDYDIFKYECKKRVPRFNLFCKSRGIKNKIKSFILLVFGFKNYCALIQYLRNARKERNDP